MEKAEQELLLVCSYLVGALIEQEHKTAVNNQGDDSRAAKTIKEHLDCLRFLEEKVRKL